jgi:hypothetical protein
MWKGVTDTQAEPSCKSSVNPAGTSARSAATSARRWMKSRSFHRCHMTHGRLGSGQGR